MKIPLIIFTAVVVLIAALLFGSIGLSRFFRYMGWPQDVLMLVGLILFLLAGMSLAASRFGDMEDREAARTKPHLNE